MALSKLSQDRLSTCHEDLQKLVKKVAENEKIAVLCGWRGEQEQNQAVLNHVSQTPWPKSKHNNMKDGKPYSLAVDLCPMPLNWADTNAFIAMMEKVKVAAKLLNISIVCGKDWPRFKDYPHVELKK